MNKTIIVSGGFDPIHVGHIRMIKEASEYGDVIVVANSDEWLIRKKGFLFMPFEQRAEILSEIKGVIRVESVDDSDNTVCKSLERIKPSYFANGGDRGKSNTPEQDVCDRLGIELLWAIGGEYKANSSSDLTTRLLRVHPNNKTKEQIKFEEETTHTYHLP
jgi:cytidyltransferase-like protein